MSEFPKTWEKFNEIFRQNVTCDNIKSCKKAELHPLSRKHNFRKIKGSAKLTPPPSPPSCFKVKINPFRSNC